ncbi:hypothetical protein MMC26_005920 [Xylographa opegraphella]|nr:hypothetical protein [Xylographa opegraphella]
MSIAPTSSPASAMCAGTPHSGSELVSPALPSMTTFMSTDTWLRADALIYFDSLCAVNGYRSGRGLVEMADRCTPSDYERGLAAQRDLVHRGDGEARPAPRALVWQG